MKNFTQDLTSPRPSTQEVSMNAKKVKKRFSIRARLMLIFGCLITISALAAGAIAIRAARKAIIERIETHLMDKANDVAKIIDGRIGSIFQFLEGIQNIPGMQDEQITFAEKS